MAALRVLKSSLLLVVLAIVLCSCAGTSRYMVASEPVVKPEEGKALVYVFRPSGMGFAINFQIWDGDKFIGLSQAKSYFQYMADPGKHTFMAIAENKAFIEADLEAGKEYYLTTGPRVGGWKARVSFQPVKAGMPELHKVPIWKTKLISVVPVEAEVKAWQEQKQEEARGILRYFETEYKSTGNYLTLTPADGR